MSDPQRGRLVPSVTPRAATARPAVVWAAAGAAVLLAGLSAANMPTSGPPPGGGPARTAPPYPPPARAALSVTPEAFGAVGDGRADDAAALQRALDSLRPGDELVLRAGRRYAHGDVLMVGGDGVRLTGPGTLVALDEERSSVRVEGDHVLLRGIGLDMAGTTRRWESLDQQRLVLAGDDVVVQRVRVRESAAAGVFVDGAQRFRIEDVDVSGTRADGVHVTGGATDGRLLRVRTSDTGDDGIGLISYGDRVNQRITVLSPVVRGTTGGRGIAIVGGSDVELRDVVVHGSAAAALLVASEGEPWNSAAVQFVRVLGASLHGANTDPSIDHGAVLVQAGRASSAVRDVLFRDLVIDGTRAGASRQVGVLDGPGEVSGIVFVGVRISRGGRAAAIEVDRQSVRSQDVVVDGTRRADDAW